MREAARRRGRAAIATVFIGTSDFAVTVLERLAALAPTARRSSSPAPTAPAGAAAGRRRRRPRSPPASSASTLLQPERLNDAASAEIAAAAPTAVCVCAYGALVREPLLSRLRAAQRPSVAAAPLARRRPDRAGDDGRRRRGPACRIMRLTAGLDSGPLCAGRPSRSRAQDTYGTLAPRLAELGAELLLASLDGRPQFVAQPRGRAHLRREDRPGGPACSIPGAPAGRARARRAGARTPTSARGSATRGSARPAGRCPARRPAPPPGELGAERRAAAPRSAPAARSSCWRVQPPGGRPMDAADYAPRTCRLRPGACAA